ncbi:PqiC family protein [Paraburkholderia sp. J10-1]|uniref:PqiC family protein n=1 Tax=Paraburkholderia sp. J10-1 TaxID=2805430 RepID=UPI002AB6AA13|nr:PqiC family protein [Paraburkholderia sp. J10-1]
MIRILRPSRLGLPRSVAVAGLVLLTACASQSARFYTLATDAPATPVSGSATSAWRIDVRPVKVPAAVARSQLVVQVDGAQVKVLEDDRWASSLADEIRSALIAGVSRQADTAGPRASVSGADVPVYEITVEVQRFESWPRSHVLVDVIWNVQRPDGAGALSCHSVLSEPVSDGYQAIVDGHRRAIAIIAAQIAEVIRGLGASTADSPSRQAVASRRIASGALSCPPVPGVAQLTDAGFVSQRAASKFLPRAAD